MAVFAQDIPTSQTDGSGSGSVFPDFDDIEGIVPTTNAITTGTTTESGSVSDSTATIIVTGPTELPSPTSSTLEPSSSSTTEAATTTVSPTSTSTTSAATNPTFVPSSTSENPDSTSSESTSSASTATESTATDSTSPDSTTPAKTSNASTTPSTSGSSTASTSTTSTSSADTTSAPTTSADTTSASTTPGSTTAAPSQTSDNTTPADTTPASSTPASTTLTPSTTIATTTAQPLSVEEQILALILSNAELFLQSTSLVDSIFASNLNIDANLDLQALSLSLIEPVENVLLNLTRDAYLTQANVLHGFLNTLQNIDFIQNRTSDNLSNILRIQQQTKNIVTDFEVKVSEVQETILGSTKGLDEKLQLVTRILQDYIKPKVSGLKESFEHLNVSQVNSLDELKNIPSIQNLTAEFIVKLTFLNNEVSILNETQENRLSTLSEAVKKWIPTDLDLVEDLLQSFSISQKQTDLAIAVCDNGSHKCGSSAKIYEENYNLDDILSKNYEQNYKSHGGEADASYYDEIEDYDASSWRISSSVLSGAWISEATADAPNDNFEGKVNERLPAPCYRLLLRLLLLLLLPRQSVPLIVLWHSCWTEDKGIPGDEGALGGGRKEGTPRGSASANASPKSQYPSQCPRPSDCTIPWHTGIPRSCGSAAMGALGPVPEWSAVNHMDTIKWKGTSNGNHQHASIVRAV
nr:serine-rich adhesin for platelets [Drosophila bipectinata]